MPADLRPRLVTAPAVPVLSPQEMKDHGRIDVTEDDGLIADYIKGAESRVDGWNGMLGRAMITQTWRVEYDCFPGSRRLDLKVGPVQSVTVAYSDGANAAQTYSASNYTLHEDDLGPFLWLDRAQDSWPDTYERPDAVRIDVVAGYGDAPSDVPESVRVALRQMVAHWYENREAYGDDLKAIPMSADALLENHMKKQF